MAIDFFCAVELPAPVAPLADPFVFLIQKEQFTSGVSGDPLAAIGTNPKAFANGGGNLQVFSDAGLTNRLPIQVVEFVTGASPSVLIWGRRPNWLAVGDPLYFGRDNTQTVQPPVTDTYGRNSVWQDYELVIHQGTSSDSTGNHSPSVVGSPSLAAMSWGGNGYLLDSASKYLQVPHSAGLNIEKNYSLSFWRKASVNSQSTFVDKVNSSNSEGFRLLCFPNPTLRTRHPNLSNANLDSVLSVNNMSLQKLESDFDAVTRKTVVDNTYTSDTPTGTVINVTDDLYIGHSLANLGDQFNGILGDIWLRKSSITDSQRTSEYNNQSDPTYINGITIGYQPVATGGVSIPILRRRREGY